MSETDDRFLLVFDHMPREQQDDLLSLFRSLSDMGLLPGGTHSVTHPDGRTLEPVPNDMEEFLQLTRPTSRH